MNIKRKAEAFDNIVVYLLATRGVIETGWDLKYHFGLTDAEIGEVLVEWMPDLKENYEEVIEQ